MKRFDRLLFKNRKSGDRANKKIKSKAVAFSLVDSSSSSSSARALPLLPEPILQSHILPFFDTLELCQAAVWCRRLAVLARTDALWRPKLDAYFADVGLPPQLLSVDGKTLNAEAYAALHDCIQWSLRLQHLEQDTKRFQIASWTPQHGAMSREDKRTWRRQLDAKVANLQGRERADYGCCGGAYQTVQFNFGRYVYCKYFNSTAISLGIDPAEATVKGWIDRADLQDSDQCNGCEAISSLSYRCFTFWRNSELHQLMSTSQECHQFLNALPANRVVSSPQILKFLKDKNVTLVEKSPSWLPLESASLKDLSKSSDFSLSPSDLDVDTVPKSISFAQARGGLYANVFCYEDGHSSIGTIHSMKNCVHYSSIADFSDM